MSHILDRASSLQSKIANIPEHKLKAVDVNSGSGCGAAPTTPTSVKEPDWLAEIDELKKRIAELQVAVTARDDFLAIAAHELRNPMTPLLGQVERLNRMVARGSCTPTQIQTGLDLIEQLVRLFIKRATTLLDVSRMTSGKLTLHVDAFDASALIRRVVDAHAPIAEHLGSVLACEEQAPVMVALDALALEQILDNILLNALRYGGGKPIDITQGHSEALIWVVVKDRGIGISQKDQSKIFQRFEQAVSSASHGGFGVGLWVVGQLVQAMGGEIKVDSIVNEGTSFQVMLPRFIAQT